MTSEDGQDKISKEYSAPNQKITCERRSYDGCDRIEARMEKAEGTREMDDSWDGWLKLQEISGWCEMEDGGWRIGG